MTELYAFISTKTCLGQIPAYLEYTETDNVHLFHIWIDKSIPLAELHPRFRLWAMGGKYDFDHEESLDMIRSRVYEPGYEGIYLVLQRLALIIRTHGRFSNHIMVGILWMIWKLS